MLEIQKKRDKEEKKADAQKERVRTSQLKVDKQTLENPMENILLVLLILIKPSVSLIDSPIVFINGIPRHAETSAHI